MAIHQTKRQSDLEKRLQLLRRQVYGKKPGNQNILSINDSSSSKRTDNSIKHSQMITTDIAYLHQDLFKILIFSTAAIGIQLVLFFLLKNHILKIYFF